eukprot:8328718-Karenia_brevis.AAC.1
MVLATMTPKAVVVVSVVVVVVVVAAATVTICYAVYITKNRDAQTLRILRNAHLNRKLNRRNDVM